CTARCNPIASWCSHGPGKARLSANRWSRSHFAPWTAAPNSTCCTNSSSIPRPATGTNTAGPARSANSNVFCNEFEQSGNWSRALTVFRVEDWQGDVCAVTDHQSEKRFREITRSRGAHHVGKSGSGRQSRGQGPGNSQEIL